jgi:hypothetical protein
VDSRKRPKGLINTYNDVLSARYRLIGLNGKDKRYNRLIKPLEIIAKDLYEEITGKESPDELRYM